MKSFKDRVTHAGSYGVVLAKWLMIGVVVGAIGGVVGGMFHLGVDKATELRQEHEWILYLLPLAGLVITGLYRLCKLEGKGTNDIIASVHFGESVPPLLVPLIFISTVITHLFGGSAGREGAALQIGGGIGYRIGQVMHMGEKEMPLATLSGMAAVFSALFGTPMAATVFAMEVISVGVFYYAGLVPCLTASLVAYLVSHHMGMVPIHYFLAVPDLAVMPMVKCVLLAVGCALVSILFCQCLHTTEHLAEKYLKNSYLRVMVGGALLIGLTLLVGHTDYNGAGMNIIEKALFGGRIRSYDWIMKIVFTAITIGCGYKGGEVVPSFFVGATFGAVAATVLGLPTAFGAAIGMVSVFCGAVNCPMASCILGIEIFSGSGILYFGAACAISYLLSGYRGLYSSQTIMYSKMRAEYINVKTK